MKVDTQCVHAGEPEPRINGSAVMPIFQVSRAATAAAVLQRVMCAKCAGYAVSLLHDDHVLHWVMLTQLLLCFADMQSATFVSQGEEPGMEQVHNAAFHPKARQSQEPHVADVNKSECSSLWPKCPQQKSSDLGALMCVSFL